MKIYFAASIRAGRQDAELYFKIVEHLKKHGKVLTEHVGNPSVKAFETGQTDEEIHDQDINWLFNSDIVIAEVSTPSLGVGYEIGRAIENNIPVYCFIKNKEGYRLSAMIGGSDKVKSYAYTSESDFFNQLDKIFNTIET